MFQYFFTTKKFDSGEREKNDTNKDLQCTISEELFSYIKEQNNSQNVNNNNFSQNQRKRNRDTDTDSDSDDGYIIPPQPSKTRKANNGDRVIDRYRLNHFFLN